MRIVLIDFGITKDLEAALGSTTQNFPTSAIMATLPYAAPEVLTRQRGVAAAQDMFAVGVMALEVHPRLVKGCDGAIFVRLAQDATGHTDSWRHPLAGGDGRPLVLADGQGAYVQGGGAQVQRRGAGAVRGADAGGCADPERRTGRGGFAQGAQPQRTWFVSVFTEP